MMSDLPGNVSKMVGAWKDADGKPSFAKVTLSVALNEESLAKRKRRVRGFATMNLVHNLTLLTAESLDIPNKKRLHFEGTNRGSVLGPVILDEFVEGEICKNRHNPEPPLDKFHSPCCLSGGCSTRERRRWRKDEEDGGKLNSKTAAAPTSSTFTHRRGRQSAPRT